MAIGVTGYQGKIGSLLVKLPGYVGLDCDVESTPSIEKELRKHNVDIIVNCAAISSPDQCELDYNKAISVNVHGLNNLHAVFGLKVLNIGSDFVFGNTKWFLPKESTKPSLPMGAYAFSKLGAESISNVWGGKTIRLSRTVSMSDIDLSFYVSNPNSIHHIPNFLTRNYLHRDFAVTGIDHFVRHWDTMPKMLHYAGTDNVSMYKFVRWIFQYKGLSVENILPRGFYISGGTSRPKRGGLNVSLAKKLKFPMFSATDTVSKLGDENV